MNKSHKNPYIGTRTVPWRPTDGRKGKTGLIVTVFNSNAPITVWKKSNKIPIWIHSKFRMKCFSRITHQLNSWN